MTWLYIIKINYWLNTKNAHSSTNKFISCGSSGKIINHESPFNYFIINIIFFTIINKVYYKTFNSIKEY